MCVCLYREISSTDVREEIAEDKLSFLSCLLALSLSLSSISSGKVKEENIYILDVC